MNLFLIAVFGVLYFQIVASQFFNDPFGIQYAGHPMQVILDKPPPKVYDSQEVTEKDLLKIIMANQKGQNGGQNGKGGKQGAGGKRGGKGKDSSSEEEDDGLAGKLGPLINMLGGGGSDKDDDSGSNENGIGDLIGGLLGGGSKGGGGGANILGNLGGMFNNFG